MNTENSIFDWMKSPDNLNQLVLMRGVPSSGKSYRAKELSLGDDSLIFSADHFFGLTKEEYVANWCREKLNQAHRQCQWKTREAMQRQRPLVIVDNTNVRIADMMPYFGMAVQYQYKVSIEEPTSPWWVNDIAPLLLDKQKNARQIEAAARMLYEKSQETHAVPYESILKMLTRYQPRVTFDDLARSYCNRSPQETGV